MNIKLYRTVIVPVVLYGFETWALTLRRNVAKVAVKYVNSYSRTQLYLII